MLSAHTKQAPQEGRSSPLIVRKLGEKGACIIALEDSWMCDFRIQKARCEAKEAVQGGGAHKEGDRGKS